MDWSKAKNILIIALVITNLILGTYFFNEQKKDSIWSDDYTEDVAEYLAMQGVAVSCDLPVEKKKLPVIFVSFSRDSAECSYKGIPVESEIDNAVFESAGKATAKMIPSAKAVMNLISQEDISTDGLEILDVQLVYWTEHNGSSSSGQDTAFPSWKIQTNAGKYYITAYYEF